MLLPFASLRSSSQPPDPTFRAWLWSLPLMVGFALGFVLFG